MITVLSLFDGISCGRLALERAGIPVKKYYASEIDEHAIAVSRRHHRDIIRVGDVCELDTSKLDKIDLLIGGSPCQSFSIAGKLDGFDGESRLFWEFVRVMKETKPRYFMLENVTMKKEWRDIITKEMGVEPIEINSGLVSAQERRRLYWTNIPIDGMRIEDKKIYLKDVIGVRVKETFDRIVMGQIVFDMCARKHEVDYLEFVTYLRSFKGKYKLQEIADYCGVLKSTAEHWFRRDKCFAFPDPDSWFKLKELFGIESDKYDREMTEFDVYKGSKYDMGKRIYYIGGKYPTLTTHNITRHTLTDGSRMFILTPEHAEVLQTLPKGYTEGLSNAQRFKVIGNGWTIDVVAEIFKGLIL